MHWICPLQSPQPTNFGTQLGLFLGSPDLLLPRHGVARMASAEVVCMVFPAVMMDLRLGNGHGVGDSLEAVEIGYFFQSPTYIVYITCMSCQGFGLSFPSIGVSENMASHDIPNPVVSNFPEITVIYRSYFWVINNILDT